MKNVGVIGAGAAGLIAAGRAAERGHNVFLFEKNNIAGRKIRITGKGRCNLTNACDADSLILNVPGNGKFLYSSFNSFSNKDVISFFERMGMKVKVERGERVFPESDSAKDVVDALMKYASTHNVQFIFKKAVDEIMVNDGHITGVRLFDGSTQKLDTIIVATGGISYPGTGSTGDGHKMVRKLGHTVTDLKPSLVPMNVKENWVKELQGLSLKNIAIKMLDIKGNVIYTDFGEMMFTHYGVTGPVILSASRHVLKYNYKNVFLSIDLKPALSEEKLDNRIQRDFSKFIRKQYKNSLNDLLPSLLVPVVINLSNISPGKPVNQITKEERKRLVTILKHLTCEITGSRSFDEAIVTAGGIAIKEVNPVTMESKLINELYFAGEILDLDAYTGGFNLTIAFSTGYAAGNSV